MTQAEQLQRLFRDFEDEHDHIPASTREVIEWGLANNRINLPEIDPVDILASQMSRALREEYATDQYGRRYRVNHAVRYSNNGAQMTFWGMLDFADRPHMEMAFAQRREGLIGAAYQLRTDVDVYNDHNPTELPLALDLDFTEDVAERMLVLQE